MKTKLFVYGSLKQGFISHDIIAYFEPEFVGHGRTKPEYELRSLGDFPALVESKTKDGVGVFGEIYDISFEAIPYLDRYEGVGKGLYERRLIELVSGEVVSAYVFVYDDVSGNPLVESGIWA